MVKTWGKIAKFLGASPGHHLPVAIGIKLQGIWSKPWNCKVNDLSPNPWYRKKLSCYRPDLRQTCFKRKISGWDAFTASFRVHKSKTEYVLTFGLISFSFQQDSLQGTSAMVASVLPQDHVIARHLERLASDNMSSKAKAQRREEAQLIEVVSFAGKMVSPLKSS